MNLNVYVYPMAYLWTTPASSKRRDLKIRCLHVLRLSKKISKIPDKDTTAINTLSSIFQTE